MASMLVFPVEKQFSGSMRLARHKNYFESLEVYAPPDYWGEE
jgi:hypothetical protein